MSQCNRCGKCCFYYLNGKLKKCRYLLIFSNKKTACSIYTRKQRIGLEIDKGIFCNEDTQYNYKDCPYNSPEKPDFELIQIDET